MMRALPAKREKIASVLLLILQPVFFFRRVLFHPRAHIPFDIETFHFPLAAYIARSVRQGHFPLWDPYPYGGMPIHADITAQLFYPLTWISILLGNHSDGRKLFYWLEWQIPLHMIVAGLFTYWLAREMKLPPVAAFLGATVYQLGGFFASQAQHLSAVACAAWFPLILLCLLKLNSEITVRWTAVLALAVSLIVVAGMPAVTAVIMLVGFFVTLALWFTRGRSLKFLFSVVLAFVWGLCISCAQWIPTYQVSRISIATMRAQWLGNGGGLRWQSLVSLVAPDYYHIFEAFNPKVYTLPINFTLLYIYCGLFPLALMLSALFVRNNKLAKGLLLCTFCCAIWMLGDTTPVYPFIFTHLPAALASPLYAEYALAAFSLAAGLTAAAALARLAASRNSVVNGVIWILVLATSADLYIHGSNRPMNTGSGSWSSLNSEYQIYGYPGALEQIRNLADTATPARRVDFADIGRWNFVLGSEVTRVPTMDGDNALMFKRVYLLRHLYCGGNYWERELPVNRFHSPLLRMTDIGMLAATRAEAQHQLAQSGLPHIADIAGLALYAVPDTLPRFYLVPSVHPSHGESETYALLGSAGFVPEKEAIVEGPPAAQSLSTGQVALSRYSPNYIELNTDSAGPAFLATSEPLYPGWTATVNSHPAQLYMTNGAFRGLYVGAGKNTIVMRYWPPLFGWWLSMSGAALLLAGAAAFHGGRWGLGTFNP